VRQVPKVVTRQVKIMTNPHPTYVSVVNHGAIQEPFTTLKHAQKRDTPMPIKPREESKPAVVLATKTAVAVQKIVFDANVFKVDDDVTKYLSANGYEDFVVEKSDDNEFVAKANDADDIVFAGVQSVKMENGVTGYVGKKQVAETTAKSAEPKPPVTKQERAIKYDWWDAYQSKGESVADVLEAGMSDGIPPGLDAVVGAAMTAVGNVLGGDDAAPERSTKIAGIFGELTQIVTALDVLYRGAISSEGAVEKHENVKKFVEAFKTEVTALTTQKTETAADPAVTTTQVVPPVQEPATKVADPAATVAGNAPAATVPGLTPEQITAAVASALAPVQKQLDDMKRNDGALSAGRTTEYLRKK
jgi:hypothetical protein